MKGQLNPPLKEGDKIICYHMEGETSVPPGTIGVVRRIGRDPFEDDDSQIIEVKWENGSTLALVSSTDAWKKVKEEIQEQTDSPEYNFFSKNPDVFENFDCRFLRNYLRKIAEAGIVNMVASAPLLYCGSEHLDKYYGENPLNQEAFDEVLDMADEAKRKIIEGVINYMEKNNKDMDNMSTINRFAQNFSQKIVQLYMIF